MNIKNLREILDLPLPEEDMKYHICAELAKDSDVVDTILEMLGAERERKRKLVGELNLQLSRAHILVQDKNVWKKLHEFVDGEIVNFYKTNGEVGHCFANTDKVQAEKLQEPATDTKVALSDNS